MIVVFFGLPGSGKTSLCKKLLEHTDAIHINADEIRADLSSDLGFSLEDRVEHARRLGAIARLLSNQGKLVFVDFVNPTKQTRLAFGDSDFKIYINRVDKSRYEDTNSIWESPESTFYSLEIKNGLTLDEEKDAVLGLLNLVDWKLPTTLMLGRYQPWHEGHEALKTQAHLRTEQVLVGIRDTHLTSEKDPLSVDEVVVYMKQNSKSSESNTVILRLPNITNIIYGRDVGYRIEKVELSAELQSISATQKRKELGI
jgi:hypothetical protein